MCDCAESLTDTIKALPYYLIGQLTGCGRYDKGGFQG